MTRVPTDPETLHVTWMAMPANWGAGTPTQLGTKRVVSIRDQANQDI